MRNQKGITLIALVITIIVLLILAGVSIAMLTGDNGLLTKSRQATVDNAIAAAKDEVSLAAQTGMSNYLETKYTGGNITGTGNTAGDFIKKEIDALKEPQKHGTTINPTTTQVTISYKGRSIIGEIGTDGTLKWGSITGTVQ